MRRLLLDLLAGFAAFVAVLAVSVLTREHGDIRWFALATAFAFFVAAFARGGTHDRIPWRTTVGVALGGMTPLIVMNRMGIAFTADAFFWSFLVLAAVATALGTMTRRLSRDGRVAYASALAASLAVIAVVSSLVLIPRLAERSAYQAVDQDVCRFSVQKLSGENLWSESWKGRVVVLAFWATWCTPCHAELKEVAALQRAFANDSRVLVVAIDSANHGDTAAGAAKYLARQHMTLDGAIDSVGADSDKDSWGPAAKSLGVQSLPALYVLDRSGKLRLVHSGYDGSEDLTGSLARQIRKLL